MAVSSRSRSPIFVGIDWAVQTVQVCVLDGSRSNLGEHTFATSALGLDELVDWLIELAGDPHTITIAIERPDGPVVETLLERDLAVFSLNPKQLDRFRDRHTVAGAKDDRRDAFVLADALATDGQAFRRVLVDEPALIMLRELVRCDDELRLQEGRLGNQFRDLLRRYYPQLLDLAAKKRPDPFLWDLWEAAPTPQQGARLSKARIERLLIKHRVRRLDVSQVQQALKQPALRVAATTVTAAAQHIKWLLPRLRLVYEQRRACGREMDALIDRLSQSDEHAATEKREGGGGQGAGTGAAGPAPTLLLPQPRDTATASSKKQHSDAAILKSLPGVGRAVIARVLTEAADAVRHRDLNRLRALGGSAPVTRRSGQRCRVQMRRACNARSRYAFYHWARVAMQRDQRSKDHYASLRQRGQSHGRALRGVVDRWLAVAIAMLRTDALYDPNRRASDLAAL